MRLVAITSANKPSIAINATQRAIRSRITPYMARPPEPRRTPADELFNSVHLWRRNRDGNEGSTGRICDEVAGRDKLLGIIRKVRDAHVLLVVGHNPGLHELAVSLIASGDVEARERVREK